MAGTCAGTRVQTPIVTLGALPANTWYRFSAKFTKLTATSAKIDVNLVQLDSGGNPTGTPYSGTVANTNAWSGGAPATSYFTPTSMWPAYKNHNASPGAAPADNTCYELVGGAPAQYTLTVSTTGSGSVTLNPTGGTYNSGTTVTLTAVPNANNTFSNWTGGLTGTTNPASITMNSNKTITATFTQGQQPTNLVCENFNSLHTRLHYRHLYRLV